MQFVYIAGSFLAFFLGLLVVSKKKKKDYDFVLSVWLFLISIHIAGFYFQETLSSPPVKSWYIVNAAFPLLQGVFLYLYTGLLLQKIRFKPILALHFLPFVVFAIAAFKYEQQLIAPLIVSVIISGIAYLVLTFRMLGRFQSFFKRDNHWLKILTTGLGLVWLIFISIGILNHLASFGSIRHEYIFLSVNIFVFAIGYFGLKEGHLLQEPQAKGSYRSSPMSDDHFKKITHLLEDLNTTTKFYLDPNLKIGDLARQISSPTHHLSQYFSASLDTNFYDYVNTLRINELKLRMAEDDLSALSLLGLAYECGFNSKSTFNRVFKKHTGMTPSQYLKSIK